MPIYQIRPGEYTNISPSKHGKQKVYLAHSDYNCEGQVQVKSGIAKCRKCGQTSASGPMRVITNVL